MLEASCQDLRTQLEGMEETKVCIYARIKACMYDYIRHGFSANTCVLPYLGCSEEGN